jgi:hypothetical protein
MSELSESDFAALKDAARRLESRNFAVVLASKVGVPIEALLHMLPKSAQANIGTAVETALQQCLRAAIHLSGKTKRIGTAGPTSGRSKMAHNAATAVTGALGGFFGLSGLAVELPVTTTIMLHSIAAIARSHGEDLSDPESALACMEVLALSPEGVRGRPTDGAYYATRAALAQATREAARHITQRGLASEGGPAVMSFVAKIAARFGVEVSDKVAAQLVPIVGAVGGLGLNVLFSHHFQSLAEGHFTVRRLERKYGADVVKRAYEQARPGKKRFGGLLKG